MIFPSIKRKSMLLLAGFVVFAMLAFEIYIYVSRRALIEPRTTIETNTKLDYVRYMPDSSFLVCSDAKLKRLTYRNPITGSVASQWDGGDGDFHLSEDGLRIIIDDPAGYAPGDCAMLDAATGKILHCWSGSILGFSTDFTKILLDVGIGPRRLNAPYSACEIRLVDTATGKVTARFAGNSDAYFDNLTYDGMYLTLEEPRKPTRILRTADLSVVGTLPPEVHICDSQDESLVFAIEDNGTLTTLNVKSGRHISIATGIGHADIARVSNGDLVILGQDISRNDYYQIAQVRSRDASAVIRTFSGEYDGCSYKWRYIAFTSKPIYAGQESTIFDAETGRIVGVVDETTEPDPDDDTMHVDMTQRLIISPDGARCVAAFYAGRLRLYDLPK
jgi:hypothetical protein